MIERTVVTDGIRLAVVEDGDPGRPAIVLVHGYPDTKEMWVGVASRLASRFHVVAYDVRGAGGSGAPRGVAGYDFERLADDLLAVLSAVVPERPVHLVGHDWGGIAGWEFAAMERFDGALASFTTIAGPSLDQVAESTWGLVRSGRVLEVLRRVYRSWYVLVLSAPGGPWLAWRAMQAGLPGDGPSPENRASVLNGANLYRQNILRRRRRRPPLSARVPVQLIVPTDDRYISPSYYELAEQYAPGLWRRNVPGSHWAPRGEPDLIADWIAEFVEEVEGRGRDRATDPGVRGGG